VAYHACRAVEFEGLRVTLASKSGDVHLRQVPRLEDDDRESVGCWVMTDGHQDLTTAKRRLLHASYPISQSKQRRRTGNLHTTIAYVNKILGTVFLQ